MNNLFFYEQAGVCLTENTHTGCLTEGLILVNLVTGVLDCQMVDMFGFCTAGILIYILIITV